MHQGFNNIKSKFRIIIMVVTIATILFVGQMTLSTVTVYAVPGTTTTQNTTGTSNTQAGDEAPKVFEIPKPDKIEAIDAGAKKIAVQSPMACTYNVDTKEVLYNRDGDKKMYPASTTKILTAIVAIENGDLKDKITVSHNAVYGIDFASSHIALEEGEVITLEQALYGLLLSSANDCAMAIAEHVGGSVEEFAEMMNEKAEEIGCTNSHFTNPHGLHNKNHYTTAHDLALIMAYCVENETFVKIDSTLKYTIPKNNKKKEARELWHGHRMYENKYNYYAPVVCGKNGYVTESQFTLVTYGEQNGMRLVTTCGKCHSPNQICIDTKAQMQYFFGHYDEVKLDPKDADISTLRIGKKDVPVYTKGEIDAMLPKNHDENLISFAAKTKKDVTLPVDVDEKLGSIDVLYDDRKLGSTYLYASEKVDKHGPLFKIAKGVIFFLALVIIMTKLFSRKGRKRRSRS